MGRCMGMMERYLGDGSRLCGLGVKDGKNDLENWSKTLAGQRMIWQEAMLLLYNAGQDRLPKREVTGLTLSRRKVREIIKK